jgi:hypothetical protein
MSTTTIQTLARTILDPRDVATLVAALLCYQFHGATGDLPDDVTAAATGDGTHDPLTHEQTHELLDLLRAGDVVEINTLGNDWDETGSDLRLALDSHEAARRTQDHAAPVLVPDRGIDIPVC